MLKAPGLHPPAIHSHYRETLKRLYRGFREGSERYSPRNPQATLNEPSMNPIASAT